MAALILGTVGQTLLGSFGGFLGSTLGSIIDAWLFAPDPPDQEGPRIEDTDTVAADVGVPLPYTLGANRVGGVLIHTSELIETANVEELRSGKHTYTNTTYTYSQTFGMLFNDGAILGVGRIWADGKLYRATRDDFSPDTTTYEYNVGGYPYPSWYRNAGRMYDPAQIPWSLDPAANGAGATRWTLDVSGNLVVADAAAQAAAIANNQIVYWQDPVSSYYLPVDTTVAYQAGVKSKEGDTVRDWTDYYNLFAVLNDFSPWSVLPCSGVNSLEIYRGTTDQPVDSTLDSLQNATGICPAYRGRAYMVFDNLQLEDFGNRLPNLTFEVVRFEDETPTTSIDLLMAKAGVSTDYYDVAALPSTGLRSFLPGYSLVRRTTIRKAIEAILEAYEFDASEINLEIKFRPRPRAADHVIDWTELAAHNAGDRSTQEQLALVARDKITLPRTIEATYNDIERDYQDGSKRFFRTQTLNDHTGTVGLAMVLYGHYVAGWTQRKMQDIWNGQRTVEFDLPPKYIYVSPSDIILVVTDTVIGTQGGNDVVASFNVKVTEVRRGVNGIITVKGIVSLGALYPADDYANFGTENNYTSYTNYQRLGDTLLQLLDIPPLTVPDSLFYGVYFAMCDSNRPEWPGGDLLQSLDGGSNYTQVGASVNAAAMGQITTGTITTGASSTVDTQSFIVTLDSATASLSGTDYVGMFNFENLAIIGDEIVSFTDVTNLGNRQFQISGHMIRGLKDTDPTSKGTGTRFILLSSAVKGFTANINNIDVTLDYKPVTIGLTEAITTNQTFSHTGARVRPFRPTFISGTRDGSNNLTIDWVRQDRTYTRWINNADLPLSEMSEEYQIDILDAPGGNVLRTVSVDDATTYTYSAANQTSDGLTPGDPVDIVIYQISQIFGRGNPGVAVV